MPTRRHLERAPPPYRRWLRRADSAIAAYRNTNANGLRHEPLATAISDMVADVLLWALTHDLDPDQIIEVAQISLTEERAEVIAGSAPLDAVARSA